MKFELQSDINFEADTIDHALMKLALHFMSLMKESPVLVVNNEKPIDMIKVINSAVPQISKDTSDGFINVDFVSEYKIPEMTQ